VKVIWVIDATKGYPLRFRQAREKFGGELEFISRTTQPHAPDASISYVFHRQGEDAANGFYDAHKAEIDALYSRARPSAAVAKKYKRPSFNPALIKAACADGNVQAIRDLSDAVRVAMRDHPEIAAAVRRGEALGDSDVANFAYRMLKSCHRHSIPPLRELVDLFQILLKQDRKARRSGSFNAGRASKVQAYVDQNPTAGVNKIERGTGVSKKTIGRWLENGVVRK
jgi:hypothetical protein